jgi:hypothetical protein
VDEKSREIAERFVATVVMACGLLAGRQQLRDKGHSKLDQLYD